MTTISRTDRRPPAPWAIALLACAAFAVLALAVHTHAALTRVDPDVAGDILGLRSVWATHVAQTLTLIGGEVVVGAGALLLLIAALQRCGRRYAAIVAATMGTSVVLTVTVKLLFGRARPGVIDRLGPVDGSYSFPSGHTLNSAVFLGLVCLVFVPLLSNAALRRLLVGASFVLAVGIGASRVYLGYHWTTDVLASWCIAAVLLSLAHVAVVRSGPAQSGAIQVRRSTITP